MIHNGAVNNLIVQYDLITNMLEMIHFPNMKRVHSINAGDMLLSMERVNKLTVVGTETGNILVYDN
jgi:hypothetical protein